MGSGFGVGVDGYRARPELLGADSGEVYCGCAGHACIVLVVVVVKGREGKGAREDVPGVWAVLVSRLSPGITRTPVCFHASSGGAVGGSVSVGAAIVCVFLVRGASRAEGGG